METAAILNVSVVSNGQRVSETNSTEHLSPHVFLYKKCTKASRYRSIVRFERRQNSIGYAESTRAQSATPPSPLAVARSVLWQAPAVAPKVRAKYTRRYRTRATIRRFQSASEGGLFVLRIHSPQREFSRPNLRRFDLSSAKAPRRTQRRQIHTHKQIQTQEFDCVYRAS
jgi:hypothetical protein